MTELRDNYEKSQRKLETADANLKKFVFNKKINSSRGAPGVRWVRWHRGTVAPVVR
jgi:hypothetical protein